jgi:hypothetical protein
LPREERRTILVIGLERRQEQIDGLTLRRSTAPALQLTDRIDAHARPFGQLFLREFRRNARASQKRSELRRGCRPSVHADRFARSQRPSPLFDRVTDRVVPGAGARSGR